MKLYEYLSQGKPVVATDLAELRDWADLIYLAEGPAQFAERLDTALAESSSALRAKRTEFARRNDWPSRVRQLDAGIETHFPKVSLLLVTYNSAEFVAPCLNSILENPAYPALEVIVLDNNSSDATPPSRSNSLPGIRVFTPSGCRKIGASPEATTPAAARANGEYLVVLNPDTMVTPGWIGRLIGSPDS